MNRREVKEQNDISRTIGNLPKRLQKKFAERTGMGQNAMTPNGVNFGSDGGKPIPGILRIRRTGSNVMPLEDSAKKDNIEAHTIARQYPGWFHTFRQLNITCKRPLKELHDYMTEALKRKTISKVIEIPENWESFESVRNELKDIFQQMLLHHLTYCSAQNLESYFWKMLYHNIIEYFKTTPRRTKDNREAKFIHLVDDGVQFYTGILNLLEENYRIDEKQNDDENSIKYESVARASMQRLLISLGDLFRYKARILNSNDFTESYKLYQRAQTIVPANGVPYHQLAILSLYSRKQLDSVYYHMRSLMAYGPVLSARESLEILFDEFRRKFEQCNKPPGSDIQQHGSGRDAHSLRKEVWVYPDGYRRLHKNDVVPKCVVDEHKRLTLLPAKELVKEFVSTYLYIIGKLFSGIGLEHFHENFKKLLMQINIILNPSQQLVLSRSCVLKVAALNIFVVHHNNVNDSRKEIFHYAFYVSNQFLFVTLKAANALLLKYKEQCSSELSANNSVVNLHHLNTLLQYIKTLCQWMSANPDIWKSPDNDRLTNFDSWREYEQHIQILREIKSQTALETNYQSEAYLDEDVFLNGFVLLPLIPDEISKQYIINNELEQFNIRVTKILQFDQIMSQHINAWKNATIQVQSTPKIDYPPVNDMIIEEVDKMRCKPECIIPLPFIKSEIDESSDMQQLCKLKKELEAKTNKTKIYAEKLEEMLRYVDKKLYIEVHPKYLLPDTNCFIDYLEDIQALSRNPKYTIIVPLIVVKELDGLSKGATAELGDQYHAKHNRIHHCDGVSTKAKKSLEFVKSPNSNIKCATIKGSILSASLFALVDENNASNDDKILATALAVSKSVTTEIREDMKTCIRTELVLITSDRNLRVKAISRKLAVSELKEFVNWVNDCSDQK